MVLSKMLGNAGEIDSEKLKSELRPVLLPEEQVKMAYRVIRDMFIFTDRRLILIDKQGVTGKKVEYHTIPYSSIAHFSVETAGRFDMDAELKIWVRGMQSPIERELKKGSNIIGIQKILAHVITK